MFIVMANIRNPYKQLTPTNVCVIDIKTSVYRSVLPYEDLYIRDNGNGSCTVLSDVDLLFNQQRLDKMNRTALLDQLQGAQFTQDPVLSELRNKVPDEYILKFVKSRYIQSPSELRNWASYLERTYSTELADAQAAAAAADAQAAAAAEPAGSSAVSVE